MSNGTAVRKILSERWEKSLSDLERLVSALRQLVDDMTITVQAAELLDQMEKDLADIRSEYEKGREI